MGKTSKWIRNFLTGGKKDKDRDKEKCTSNVLQQSSDVFENNPATTPISISPATPKEKRRWSFRKSSTTAAQKGLSDNADNNINATPPPASAAGQVSVVDLENDQKKHALAMAAATAAAAEAAVAAAKAAAAVIRLTAVANGRGATAVEEAAAIKIQSVFRSYLARKALSALKGLVKLQALVRGHLVRKQATATLRCMQALVTVQARARAQRIRMAAEESKPNDQRQFNHRKSTQDGRIRHTLQDFDREIEENIKIVEMDIGESKVSTNSRNSYSKNTQPDSKENRFSTHRAYSKHDLQRISPAPSARTDMSPRACSGHFEGYSFGTEQSSPQYHSAVSKSDVPRIPFSYPRGEYADSSLYNDYLFFPNYMANTESSRAKVRSQSAPKSRPDSFERQPSRRRLSIEGRNVPRAVRMQRSSSHVGSTAQNYQYRWSIKLDGSTVSLKDSECESSSTALTNTNYCRSLVGFDVHGNTY